MKPSGIQNAGALLLVLLIGALLAVLLVNEYRANTALIEQNQRLLKSTAYKTLNLFIEEQLSTYPRELNTLKNQWKAFSPDIYWFNQGQQMYPFVAGSDMESIFEQMWSDYADDGGPSEHAGSEDATRRFLTLQVLSAARAGDQDLLRENLGKFLTHKENYSLLPVEEIVSWLVLLAADDVSWSDEFAGNALIKGWQGGRQTIASVADSFLLNSNSISAHDLQLMQAYITRAAKRHDVSIAPFQQYLDRLYQPLQLPDFPDQGIWLLDEQWLVIARDNKQHIVIPAELEKRIARVEELLKHQGLLNSDDQLTTSVNTNWLSLDESTISINKISWEQALQRQRYFFLLKLLLLAVLLVLAVIAGYAVRQRIRRKQAFIRMQEDFINLISHELKTPLASIRIMSETLDKRLQQNLEPRDYTRRIIAESDRLQMMVSNILSYNQLGEARDSLSSDQFDLLDVITETTDDFEEAGTGQLEFRLNIPENTCISINRLLFVLVIRNLISNAIKYKAHAIVKVNLEYEAESHSLIVRDNGIGIPDNEWEQVFEKFYRSPQTSRQKGIGLGLSLSRAIMRKYGGDLKVLGSDSHGTHWQIQFGRA